MTDEQQPIKAHDVDKNDPEYQHKVSDVIRRRFDEEKKKSFEREKAKMDEGRKKGPNQPASNVVTPTPPPESPQQVDQRDPEEYVKRKEIVALVNQLNRSFAIIEKHRLKVEKFMVSLKAALSEE